MTSATAHTHTHSNESCSQIGQDVFALQQLGWRRNGYFVDIGAHDGKSLSNTWLMEHRFGWRGLCVEPLPDAFQRLRACRPRSHCFQVAAADRNSRDSQDTLKFTVSRAMDGMLSGISDCIDAHSQHVQGCPTIQVALRTVTSLLDECGAPAQIDYMSIDTEGSELLVLHGIDWQRYRFGMISVEHNNVEPRRSQMRQLLQRNGYRWLRENHWDDDYVPAEQQQ